MLFSLRWTIWRAMNMPPVMPPMMPGPVGVPALPLTPVSGVPSLGPLPQGARGTAAARAPYFSVERVARIVGLAQKDNDIWKETNKRKRGELSAGSVDAAGVPRDTAHIQTAADTESKVIFNFVYRYVTILLGKMYANAPAIDVGVRENTGAPSQGLVSALQAGALPGVASLMDAREAYALAVRQELEFSSEFGYWEQKTGQTLQDSLLTGQCWQKIYYDAESGYEDVEVIPREELFVDPQARYDVRQARYVVHTVMMPLREAQEFIAGKMDAIRQLHMQAGGQVNEDGTSAGSDSWYASPGFDPAKMAGNEQSGDKLGVAGDGGEDPENNDTFKFYEVWVKDGDDRFVFYTTKDKSFTFKLPWPFTLPHKEFPFAELAFNRQGRKVSDAFTELDVVSGLILVYRLCSQYMRGLILRAMAKKIGYDIATFPEPGALEKLLSSNNGNLEAVGMNFQGKDMDKVLKVINFNDGDPVLMEAIHELKTSIDEMLGINELMSGADDNQDSQITATEARLKEANAATRFGRKVGIFDEFQERVLKLRAAVASQTVSPEKLNQIAGPVAATLWAVHVPHPNDFAAEFEVSIEAGSSGQTHRMQKAQMLQQLGGMARNINVMMAQSAQPPVFNLRDLAVATARAVDPDADKFIEELPAGMPGGQMPPQQMPQPGPGQVQQSGPQQMPPPQPMQNGPRTGAAVGFH